MQIKNKPATVTPSTTQPSSVQSNSTVRQPGTTTSQPTASRYASSFELAPKQPNRLVEESAFRAMVEVLPPETDAQGRPTDADLDWALKAAFSNKHIVGRDPSAEEKNAWMAVARQLRENGKSADDIRQTLIGQMNDAKGRAQDPNRVLPLPTRADGRPTNEDLEWALKEAFTNKYIVGRNPSAEEKTAWMEVANQLREKGKSADDIRQTLVGQMNDANNRAQDPNRVLPLPTRADGRPTDADLEWALKEAFTNKHIVGRNPSAEEKTVWMGVANQLREKGKSADDIRQTLIGQMNDANARAQDPNRVLPLPTRTDGRPTDADLEWALKEAFTNKHIVGRNPSAEEKKAWMEVANQMREKGKSADDIRQTLVGQMNDANNRAKDPNKVLPLPTRTDGRPTNEDLEWALKEAFTNKHIVGRDPSAEEKTAWMEVANQMREKGKSADDIRQTLIGQMNDAKGRAQDPNRVLPLPTRADGRPTDGDLEWALKEAFTNKHVVGRPPSSNEFSRWMEVARKLREKGKSADDIRQTLIGQMSQAKDRAEGR